MFTFDTIAQILWSSFATSSYYVLFALAFALVLKVNGVFNFAQAAIMTVAFYAAFSVVSLADGSGALGFFAAIVVSVAFALLIELVGFKKLRTNLATPMSVFIFTLIVSELIAYFAMLIFGTWPTTIFPSLFWPVALVGNIAVSAWDIPAVLSTIGAIAALFAFIHLTRAGQFMTAVADNADLAELYGIAKSKVYMTTMIVAGLLVGLGMFLYGTRAQVQPTTSFDVMLFAVVATIIGGIGNLWGAAIAAFALVLLQNSSILFIPSEWQGFLLYIFLFLAIIFFPNGIKLPQRLHALRAATSPALDRPSKEA
jgi:branched-subunit amino acid ABC-type transport system permease component